MELISLGNSVDGLFVENKRFKTTVVSFNFYTPLCFETASENALLIYVLSSCSKKYESFRKLNFALSLLYGASVNVAVNKLGDIQLMQIAVSVINDEFSLDGSSVVSKAVELLESLIFEPKTENGRFFTEDVERERRKLGELIAAEINDKRRFARNRLFEEAFKGQPFGISALGTEKSLKSVTEEDLYNAWKRLLKTSYLRVNVIGKSLPDGIFENISEKFSKIERNVEPDFKKCRVLQKTDEVKSFSDKLDVAQGKLVMGFSSETCGPEAYDLLIATDIFGGGPYSKLFENVREKMSLCYYCSARPIASKGFVYVDSGVEKENAEKAKKAILEQLQSVKNGDFSDFTFDASLKNIVCGIKSANDRIFALDSWYASKIFTDTIKSPEESAEAVQNVTREQVIKAANGIDLHTVYEIIPSGNGGADNAD
ncbi:MAG: insulinase family protein [Clostridiales bacterium]|nr:insulinase family protein [Candidatus Equinaster intestinalis]